MPLSRHLLSATRYCRQASIILPAIATRPTFQIAIFIFKKIIQSLFLCKPLYTLTINLNLYLYWQEKFVKHKLVHILTNK